MDCDQIDREAGQGKQVGRQAGRQAGRQVGRLAGWQGVSLFHGDGGFEQHTLFLSCFVSASGSLLE